MINSANRAAVPARTNRIASFNTTRRAAPFGRGSDSQKCPFLLVLFFWASKEKYKEAGYITRCQHTMLQLAKHQRRLIWNFLYFSFWQKKKSTTDAESITPCKFALSLLQNKKVMSGLCITRCGFSIKMLYQ